MKPLLEQGLEPALRSGTRDRSDAGVPPGCYSDVRPLAALTRRFVFAVAHLSNEAMRVANASTNPSSLASGGGCSHSHRPEPGRPGCRRTREALPGRFAHRPRQARQGAAAGDQSDAHFPLRQNRLFPARETHATGDRRDGRARQAHEDVRPRLQPRPVGPWGMPVISSNLARRYGSGRIFAL